MSEPSPNAAAESDSDVAPHARLSGDVEEPALAILARIEKHLAHHSELMERLVRKLDMEPNQPKHSRAEASHFDRTRISPYSVREFAVLIRRHREYVSERCKSGLIATLPGKPYRIPVTELAAWTTRG